MALPPRLRLLTSWGWDGLGNAAHKLNVQPGLTSSNPTFGNIVSPGLRGTGQAIGPVRDISFATAGYSHGGHWNSFGICFDYQQSTIVDSIVVEVYLLGTGLPIQCRIDTNGFFYVRNTADTVNLPTWVSTKKYIANAVAKVELLMYIKGGVEGYFELWIDGLLVLGQYGVNLSVTSGADAGLGGFRWHDDINLDNVFVSVGYGGFTDGDVLSDTAGNPQLIQQTIAGQGIYANATPTGGATAASVVDEITSNESNVTDYATLPSSTLLKDSYTLTALPGTVSRVISAAGYYLSKTDTSGGQVPPDAFLRMNPEPTIGIEDVFAEPMGTTYASSQLMTDGKYFRGFWRKSFATGRPFTVAEINAMEIGWRPAAAVAGLTYVGHVWTEIGCYVSPPAAVTPSTSHRTLLLQRTHRYAWLYKLIPRWGRPFFFTDHNAPLVVGMETYLPSGGWSATSVRAELGLKDADVDFQGVISSGAITASDIRSGRYRGATITAKLVDWRYPYAGAFVSRFWTIEDFEADGEKWRATVSGIQARLHNKVGEIYAPRCRFRLYDNDYPIPGLTPDPERGCKLDSMRHYRTFSVGSVTDRRVFGVTVNGSPSVPTGWYNDGFVIFITGPNSNIVGEIRDSTGGTITLHLPMPNDVEVGREGSIWPGCNFLHGFGGSSGDCVGKFFNGDNWGGENTQPGTDESVRGGEL